MGEFRMSCRDFLSLGKGIPVFDVLVEKIESDGCFDMDIVDIANEVIDVINGEEQHRLNIII